MFPIRDTIRSYSFPIVNWLILIANTLVFLFELMLSPVGLEKFIGAFGLVPARLNLLNPFSFLPFFNSYVFARRMVPLSQQYVDAVHLWR